MMKTSYFLILLCALMSPALAYNWNLQIQDDKTFELKEFDLNEKAQRVPASLNGYECQVDKVSHNTRSLSCTTQKGFLKRTVHVQVQCGGAGSQKMIQLDGAKHRATYTVAFECQ